MADLTFFQDENDEIKNRPIGKSSDDVIRVATKHKGSRDDIVDKFIDLHLGEFQWEWYDTYTIFLDVYAQWAADHLVWIIDNQVIIAWNIANPGDLQDELPEPIAPTEPPQVPITTVEQWRFDNYLILRTASYPSLADQTQLQGEDIVNTTQTWQGAMLAIEAQYPDS